MLLFCYVYCLCDITDASSPSTFAWPNGIADVTVVNAFVAQPDDVKDIVQSYTLSLNEQIYL